MDRDAIVDWLTVPSICIKFGTLKLRIPTHFLKPDWKDFKKIKIKYDGEVNKDFSQLFMLRLIESPGVEETEDEFRAPDFGRDNILAAVKLSICLDNINLLMSMITECVRDGYVEAYEAILDSELFWTDFLSDISIVNENISVIFDSENIIFQRLLMKHADRKLNASHFRDKIFQCVRDSGSEFKDPENKKMYGFWLNVR